MAGTSEEVIRYHYDRHLEVCPQAEEEERLCPCGSSVAIVCVTCETPLFITWAPNLPGPCEHAIDLMPPGSPEW